MRGKPLTLAFLLAYLIYNDGIQTVISQASVYGSEELGLSQSTLITAVLLVQVLAVAGALGMGRLARTYGAKRTILGSLVGLDADAGRRVLPARRRAGVVLRPGRRASASSWAAARPCPGPCSPIWSRPAKRPSTSRRTR